jgi:hypothetical protein
MLPSHAGDGAIKVTWLWRDVDAESCWHLHCNSRLYWLC